MQPDALANGPFFPWKFVCWMSTPVVHRLDSKCEHCQRGGEKKASDFMNYYLSNFLVLIVTKAFSCITMTRSIGINFVGWKQLSLHPTKKFSNILGIKRTKQSSFLYIFLPPMVQAKARIKSKLSEMETYMILEIRTAQIDGQISHQQ